MGQDEKLRYIVHFSDGGAGTRDVDERLDVGSRLNDGGRTYEVERVEQPRSPCALGRAWVRLVD